MRHRPRAGRRGRSDSAVAPVEPSASDGRLPAVIEFADYGRLVGHGRRELRADALAIAAAGLAAADPVAAFRRRVRRDGTRLWVDGEAFELGGRSVYVLGAGKASIGLAGAVDELLGDLVTDGAVVVKHGQGRRLAHIEVIEAAHPVPDDQSLLGGRRLLEIAERAGPHDLVIALVTGGSSSLAVVPAEDISLADKIATNRLLLASGADIVSMNNVRKHISRIKGGLLGAACGCTIVNLSVSDVVGDPPDYFTDLTVPDRSTFAMAQETCDRWDLWQKLPPSVAARLRRADPADETPKTLPDVHTFVLADSAGMCEATAGEARRRGYAASIVTLELEGEATEAGRWLAERLLAAPPGTALIAGGENTVTLNERGNATAMPAPTKDAIEGATTNGAARGGPSQEAALAAALALDAAIPSCLLCLDSDGTDGPTDAAGGLVDDLTANVARGSGLDLPSALGRHAAFATLAALGDLLVTGPTGTNVNDLKLALKSAGGEEAAHPAAEAVVQPAAEATAQPAAEATAQAPRAPSDGGRP